MDRDYEVGQMPPRPEEFADWPASPYCPHFIEKLLLAIIDAHPLQTVKKGDAARERARQIRLSAALKALFGHDRDKAIHREAYDLPDLIRIARERLWFQRYREYQEDLVNPDAELTDVDAMQAVMRALAGKSKWDADLQTEYVRLMGKYVDKSFQEYALIVLDPDLDEHPEETQILEDLNQAAEILARWGVRVDIDPERLGLISLTNARSKDPFLERRLLVR